MNRCRALAAVFSLAAFVTADLLAQGLWCVRCADNQTEWCRAGHHVTYAGGQDADQIGAHDPGAWE